MRNDGKDDFLQRLRKEPSAKFLASLKGRLERQVIDQRKARRTLFRTAILAALLGGSAVAIAFVAWRIMPRAAPTAQVREATMERSTAVKNMISSPQGGGVQRPAAAPESASTTANGAPATAVVKNSAARDSARGPFGAAGIEGFVFNLEKFVRRPVELGLMLKPELVRTTSVQAMTMLCHDRGSAGADSATADLIGTDQRISAAMLGICKRNGVLHITELRPGFEAVVLARSRLYGAPQLTARNIFLALAAEVPDANRPEIFIKNPYRAWNDIDNALPGEKIEIIGPAVSSSTVAAFARTVMEAGCNSFPSIAVFRGADPERFDKLCHTLRTDGSYRVQGIDEDLLRHLETYPNAMALFTFREAQYRPSVIAASIDDVVPSRETFKSGTYFGSRPIFLYVNSARTMALPVITDLLLKFERWVSDPNSDSSLMPRDSEQQQIDAQNALTLPDVKLE